MSDRIDNLVLDRLRDQPLTFDNVQLMITLEADRAIKAHFNNRWERFWIWVQRLGWIAAILVAVTSILLSP